MLVRTLLAACAAFTVAAPVVALAVEPAIDAKAPAASSPIVYQGRLSYLDIPVSASADLRFRAYTAEQGGEQVGREISLEGVDVNQGAFEVILDFGDLPASTWLEVEVRSPAGKGDFTTLAPRQTISAGAIFNDAASAGEDASDDATGTDTASARHVDDSTPPAGSDGTGSSTTSGGASGADRPGPNASTQGGSRGGGWVMNGNNIYFNTGKVGIGLVAPEAPLHIRDRTPRVIWAVNNKTGPNGNFAIQAEADGNESRAIFARANSTSGYNYGVFGQSLSTRGTGVFGQANSTFGTGFGVTGVSRAASGTGVRGLCTNATGANYAIFGEVMSSDAWAGYFMGGQGAFVEGGLSIGEEDSFAELSISSDGAKDLLEMQVSDTTVARFTSSGGLAVGTDLTPPTGGLLSEGDIFVEDGNLRFFDESNATIIGSNTDMTFSKDFDNDDTGVLFSWVSDAGTDIQMTLDDGPGTNGVDAELTVDGDVTANGFDYAELFTIGEQGLEPGDLVVMARGHADSIHKATGAYQDLLVGVVSTDPGFIAGNPIPDEAEDWRRQAIATNGGVSRAIETEFRRQISAARERTRPIALAGRVPVKVDASYGAIRAGDRLTSSATPGHAMVQTQAGPTIGIALEDFSQGQGKLTILVQPGWFGGAAPARTTDTRNTRILELEARLMVLEELLLGETP